MGLVLERRKKLGKEAKSSIKTITIHYPLDIVATFAAKPKEGVESFYIFDQNTKVPKGRDEMLKKIGWTKLISNGIVKGKILKTIQVGVTVTDKESYAFFPNVKGQTNMLSGFLSTMISFLSGVTTFSTINGKELISLMNQNFVKIKLCLHFSFYISAWMYLH